MKTSNEKSVHPEGSRGIPTRGDLSENCIRFVAHQKAKEPLPNAFFEELDIGTSGNWIEERTGIKKRWSVLSHAQIKNLRFGKTTFQDIRHLIPSFSELSSQAWKKACQSVPEADQNCDLVVCSTSIPDFDIPSHACIVASKLGLKGASFDVNSACSSFVVGLSVVDGLLKTGSFERAALFQVERYTLRMDYSDRSSCILFGDGACAAVVERGGEKLPGFYIKDILLKSDPLGWEDVQIPLFGTFRQNGAAVQKFAITKTCEVTREILRRNGLSCSQIQYLIGHQANLRMLQSSCDKLGIEPERHLYNVDRFGNQGGAGAPSVLAENWHKFKNSDLVVVSVVGSGLTWGSVLLEFRSS